MQRNNFRRYVDREGKMPCLVYPKQYRNWNSKTHPYYVEYRNNKPVAYHGPLSVVGTHGKIYNYHELEYVDAKDIPSV